MQNVLYTQGLELIGKAVSIGSWWCVSVASCCSKVTAVSDCLLFVWSFDAVRQMTGPASPALAVFWRNYILYSVGSAFSDTTGEVSHTARSWKKKQSNARPFKSRKPQIFASCGKPVVCAIMAEQQGS